jgi:hypothetical protein
MLNEALGYPVDFSSDKELADEILEMIDFYYCRDYSLTEKAKENIVTVSPDKFVEKGGMDEQKAIEMAKDGFLKYS